MVGWSTYSIQLDAGNGREEQSIKEFYCKIKLQLGRNIHVIIHFYAEVFENLNLNGRGSNKETRI